MKRFLIIPMGGRAQRFLDAGYKVYKPFLKTNNENRIIDNIVKNFDKKNTEIIIIGNSIRYKLYDFKIPKKKLHKINISSHKLGPLYSIFLASKKIKNIVGENEIFISYSDINWNWSFNNIKKIVKKKRVVIFTHRGFHPHLEVDSKSDFCFENKKKNIIGISQKKSFSKDYKKDLLAIGCYYFSNYNIIDKFFNRCSYLFKKKNREFYIVSLIKDLTKNKINIGHSEIKNFVHLGFPAQYEDFINWREIIVEKFKKSLKFNNSNIMLMAGKGKRIQNLNVPKPFLNLNGFKSFKYILKKFGSKKNIIITLKKYDRKIKEKNLKINFINETKSMLSTVQKSRNIFKKYNKFFLTSCDCYGEFDKIHFNKFIKKNKPDLVIFGYNFSNLQKSLIGAHTSLEIKKNKILKINVKRRLKNSQIGHAGFFWINNNNVFNFIENFKKSKKLDREAIIDDYFKYLFERKKIKISYYKLNKYIHIGSVLEYKEFKYWENYFLNENRKTN